MVNNEANGLLLSCVHSYIRHRLHRISIPLLKYGIN